MFRRCKPAHAGTQFQRHQLVLLVCICRPESRTADWERALRIQGKCTRSVYPRFGMELYGGSAGIAYLSNLHMPPECIRKLPVRYTFSNEPTPKRFGHRDRGHLQCFEYAAHGTGKSDAANESALYPALGGFGMPWIRLIPAQSNSVGHCGFRRCSKNLPICAAVTRDIESGGKPPSANQSTSSISWLRTGAPPISSHRKNSL
jgi:hypothetical protein